MVIGTTEFQGETPMQTAAKQLHMQPPSPRLFRPDLPVVVEQVMLKAMSKRPGDRYINAQELATAFRMALQTTEMHMKQQTTQSSIFASSDLTASSLFAPHGIFEPKWQTGTLPSLTAEQNTVMGTVTRTLPIANAPNLSTGLLSRTGMFPNVGNTGTFPPPPPNEFNPLTPNALLPTPPAP